MNALNLQIGNWIKFKSSDLNHKVVALTGKSVKVDKVYWHRINKFSPIHLEKMHLIKNGFVATDESDTIFSCKGDMRYIECDIIVDFDIEGCIMLTIDSPGRNIYMPIMFVHELQNVFNLFGIDKQIEL